MLNLKEIRKSEYGNIFGVSYLIYNCRLSSFDVVRDSCIISFESNFYNCIIHSCELDLFYYKYGSLNDDPENNIYPTEIKLLNSNKLKKNRIFYSYISIISKANELYKYIPYILSRIASDSIILHSCKNLNIGDRDDFIRVWTYWTSTHILGGPNVSVNGSAITVIFPKINKTDYSIPVIESYNLVLEIDKNSNIIFPVLINE